jgi:iron complex outermembrane receptor protein
MTMDKGMGGKHRWGRASSNMALIAALALTGIAAAPAVAAEGASADTGQGLGEIIVTARKREERLQDTPISVTVLSGEEFEKRNFRTMSDVSNATPNLVFDVGTGNTGGSANAQVFIRGVGQSDFLFSADPGVGIYIDEVYFPRAVGAILDVADFQRVEVLRGPQGTLFGKNTIGGAVNITTVRPADTLGGYVEGTTGSRNRIDARGTISLPLADALSLGLSGSTRHQDGFVKRIVAGGRLGNTDSSGGRAMLEWKPEGGWNVLLSADVTRKREQAIANELLAVGDPASNPFLALWNTFVAPTLGAGVVYDDRYVSGPYQSQGTAPAFSNLDLWGVSGIVSKVLGSVSVKSITAYRHQKAAFGADQDHSPLKFLQSENHNRESFVSQELQLNGSSFGDRFKWTLGAYYFHEKARDQFDAFIGGQLYSALEALPGALVPLGPGGTCPCAGGAGNPVNVGFDFDLTIRDRIVIDSYAAYSAGTFQVTDRFSVSGGLRFTRESKDFTTSLRRNGSGIFTLPETSIGKDWDAVTPKFGAEYRWTPDIMTYASASRGFKSGGFNGRAQSLAEIDSFDPEYSWTYEVGAKTEWFGKRLRLNTALFWNDYSDMQLTSVRSVQGAIVAVTENAGKARIKGLEVEMAARPIPAFELSGGIGYTDAKYVSLNPGATVTLNDKLPKTPKWTGNIAARYDIALGDLGTLSIGGNLAFRSKFYNETTNDELVAQKSYALLGARVTFVPASGGFEVSLFGTNLTDKRYKTNGITSLGSLGTSDASFGPPREWGLSGKIRF